MSASAHVDLDDIRARTPLLEVIRQRVELKRSGRQWVGCCPFHAEKTPSFYVYADGDGADQHFHCFGCGAHGDAIRFVMRTQGLSFQEARDALAADAGLSISYNTPTERKPYTPRSTEVTGPSDKQMEVWDEAQRDYTPLGRRYICDIRGFGDLPLPPGVRFSDRVYRKDTGRTHSALLFGCFTNDGKLARHQAVFLDPKTGDKLKIPGVAPKLTFGTGASHIPVTFAARVSHDWMTLTEGPEDAMRSWALIGWRSDASLGTGSLPKPEYPTGTKLLLILDCGVGGMIAGLQGFHDHTARGCDVRVWMAPQIAGRNDENQPKDIDDYARAAGNDAARESLLAAIAAPSTDAAIRQELLRLRPNADEKDHARIDNALSSYPDAPKPKRKRAPQKVADPHRGERERARRGVKTSLPAYYPGPTEDRETALQRQRDMIEDVLLQGEYLARARHEIRRGRDREIAFLGLEGLNLTPGQKMAITLRHHKVVAERYGFDGFLPKPDRLLITGSQGSGKTSSTLKTAATFPGGTGVVTWITAPTLSKCEDNLGDYQALVTGKPNAMPAYLVRGRSAADPQRPGQSMCVRHLAAEQISKKGLSPRQELCPTCPFKGVCGTLRQDSEIAEMDGGVFFLVSEYLFVPCPAPAADILTADEQVTIMAVSVTKTTLDVLAPLNMPKTVGSEACNTLARIRLILLAGGPILRDLRDAGIGKAELDAVAAALSDAKQSAVPSINADMSDHAIEAALEGAGLDAILKAEAIIAALRREIDLPRDVAKGISVNCNDVKIRRVRSPKGIKNATILALDGTGDPDLNRRLFGGEMRHERVSVERLGTIIGTIGKQYHKQSITGIDRYGKPIESKTASSATLRQDIAGIVERMPGKTAVFSHLRSMDALVADGTISEHAPQGHFQAVRGKNDWEDCRSALVVGQNIPDIEEIEDMALAYSIDDPEPFISMAGKIDPADEWPIQGWPYVATVMRRMRDGSLSPITTPVHPDPLCQRILEQTCHAECVQTGDRCRPIYNERDITFMNSLALDVTYDRIVTHQELVGCGNPLERACRATGILPLGAKALHRAHPGLFRTEGAAEKMLEKYPPNPNRYTLWGWGVFHYRLKGQSGRDSRVLIDLTRHADPQAALTQVLGPVNTFYAPSDGKPEATKPARKTKAEVLPAPVPQPPAPAQEPAAQAAEAPQPAQEAPQTPQAAAQPPRPSDAELAITRRLLGLTQPRASQQPPRDAWMPPAWMAARVRPDLLPRLLLGGVGNWLH